MSDFQKSILIMLIGAVLSATGTIAVLGEKISNVDNSLIKVEKQLVKRIDNLEYRQRDTEIAQARLLAAN